MFELSFSLWSLYVALLLAAVLYSSVGHGGASGYIAVMALFGLQPELMRPAALCMNIAVTAWLMCRHWHSINQLWRFAPLILAAIPAAFIGGTWKLTSGAYQLVIGAVLMVAALRMLWPVASNAPARSMSLPVLCTAGVLLGLLAGLTGVGGGIFLSPLLVVMGWSTVKQSIVPVAAFIGFNSIAGLSGYLYAQGQMPAQTMSLVAVAFVGGLLGAEISLRQHKRQLLSYLLCLVLLVAAVKMLWLGLGG